MTAKILSYVRPFFLISVTWLVFFSPLITNLYAAALHQPLPHVFDPIKTTNSDRFLSYENNSTLGINMQYPSNWERDTFNNKVAFFAPSLEERNKEIIPAAVFVHVYTMPFQVTYPDNLISQYVDNLRKSPAISEPIRVNLSSLAGNVAHNVTYSSKIGQFVYHTTDIIMLSGVKQYVITYYIRPLDNFSSYMSPIQQMIDSFEINTSMIKSNINQGISNNWFSTYENNSTLGVKIQYPSNWKRIEYGNMAVLFVSPFKRNSDRSWELFSIKVTASNNESMSKLVNQSIAIQRHQDPNFQLIKSNAITIKGNSAYMVKYKYQDHLFGKVLAMDIGMLKGGKVYWLSYIAEPAKFYSYIPTIQRMIDSFTVKGQSNSNETRNNLSNSNILV